MDFDPEFGFDTGGKFLRWRLMLMTSPLASWRVPPVRERAEKREVGGLLRGAGLAAAFSFFFDKTIFPFSFLRFQN